MRSWEGGVRGAAFISGWGIPSNIRGTINRQLMHAADWLSTLVVGVAKGSTAGTLELDGKMKIIVAFLPL